ncbi:hypothetical protein [Ralstonia solanacearum]|uniref:hypothetical protein n=1 Tax=Ralstonia solanacearum TaxID=305 RepID=UPI001FF8E7BA
MLRNSDWIGLRRPTGSGFGADAAWPGAWDSSGESRLAGLRTPDFEMLKGMSIELNRINVGVGVHSGALPGLGCFVEGFEIERIR